MTRIFVFLSFWGYLYNTDAAITAWTNPEASGSDVDGTLSVAEDQALNDEIATFVATSDGSVSEYSLVTTGTPFAVSTGGAVTITSALDFETTGSYTLEIRAVDNAQASGTATIAVTITDENDAPTFAASILDDTVDDGSKAGTTVTTVTATDQDSGDTIIYSINSGNTNGDFTVGESTGAVTVVNTIDKDTTAAYNLEIYAVDNDSTPKTASLSLSIIVESSAALFTGAAFTVLVGLLVSMQ